MKLYDELAEWWPLFSAPEDYAEEAAFFAEVLTKGCAPRDGARARIGRRQQCALSQIEIRDDAGRSVAADARRQPRAESRMRASRGRHADGESRAHVRCGFYPRRDCVHDERGGSAAPRCAPRIGIVARAASRYSCRIACGKPSSRKPHTADTTATTVAAFAISCGLSIPIRRTRPIEPTSRYCCAITEAMLALCTTRTSRECFRAMCGCACCARRDSNRAR